MESGSLCGRGSTSDTGSYGTGASGHVYGGTVDRYAAGKYRRTLCFAYSANPGWQDGEGNDEIEKV